MFDEKVIAPIVNTLEADKEKNAFCIDDQFYNYAYLKRRVAAIRKALSKVERKNIGLVANDDINTYASILALWMEGKCYVPLHPGQPLDRCLDIIEQVGITTILDSSENTRYTNHEIINTATLTDETEMAQPVKTSDESLAYILFTSGSTGRPKGVPITRGNVASFTAAVADMGIKLTNTDRCLQMFDLTFDLSVQSYLLPLMAGACVYTVPYNLIKYQGVFRLLDEYNLTAALMVPSVIHCLRPYMDEIEAKDMRYSLFCGEALNLDDLKAWEQCVPNAMLWNVYGPTECTIYCTTYKLNTSGEIKHVNGNVGIGKAMRGVEAIVMNDDGTPCAVGETGELCLAGGQLTPGYWKNEEKNKEAFFIGKNGTRYYRTGDICKADADGDIAYYGRKDSQVKIQGYRIELSEIECVAREFFNGEIATVAVVNSDDKGNNFIQLALEGKDDKQEKELHDYMKSKLPAYMMPQEIHFIGKFPQNANNKIDRKQIKQLIG